MNKGKEDKWMKTRLFLPRFIPTNLHRVNVKILQVMCNNLYAYNNYYWEKEALDMREKYIWKDFEKKKERRNIAKINTKMMKVLKCSRSFNMVLALFTQII